MLTSELIIREAVEEDIAAVVNLLTDDELGKHRENETNIEFNNYLSAFKRIKKDPNNFLYVACLNLEIVGTFQLTFIQNMTYKGGVRAQIEAVRIKNTYQNKQLGTKMINWIIDKSREEGATMLQLSSNKIRQEAIKFYEKMGFEASHVGMKLFL